MEVEEWMEILKGEWMNSFFMPLAENQKGEKLVSNLERLESLNFESNFSFRLCCSWWKLNALV